MSLLLTPINEADYSQTNKLCYMLADAQALSILRTLNKSLCSRHIAKLFQISHSYNGSRVAPWDFDDRELKDENEKIV